MTDQMNNLKKLSSENNYYFKDKLTNEQIYS
jgi:hypothetical protein